MDCSPPGSSLHEILQARIPHSLSRGSSDPGIELKSILSYRQILDRLSHQGGPEYKMGGKFQREETCVYLCLIHFDVWQKPKQYCKVIILQLNKFFKKGEKSIVGRGEGTHDLGQPFCGCWM